MYSTCVGTQLKTKGKASRERVLRGKSVTYQLKMANKLQEGLCVEDLCVRIELPAGTVFAKSRLFPSALAKDKGSQRRRKSTQADSVVPSGNGTTSVLWSGISLRPGGVGYFSVKMRAVGAPGGALQGALDIHASIFQCNVTNGCTRNVSPTSVRPGPRVDVYLIV